MSSKWSPVSAIYLHGRESDCNLKWSRNVHRRQDFPTTWHAFFELCVHSLWQGDCVQLRCPSEVALPWKNQRFVACFATRKGLPWRCSTNDNVEFIAPWKHRPKESQKRSQAQRYWGNGKLKKLLQRLSAIKRLRFTRLPSLPIFPTFTNATAGDKPGQEGMELKPFGCLFCVELCHDLSLPFSPTWTSMVGGGAWLCDCNEGVE